MEMAELRSFLDCRFVECCMLIPQSNPIRAIHALVLNFISFNVLEYMDDHLVHDCGWTILVAGLALRLDRLYNIGHLCDCHGPHCNHLPHSVRSSQPSILWHMGLLLADSKSRGHGCNLVWRSGMC